MSKLSAMAQTLQQHPLVRSATQYWHNLNQREQRLISALGVVVGIAVLYFLIWQPSYQSRLNAEQQLHAKQQQLSWVKQSLARYQAIKASVDHSTPSNRGSLSQRLSQAAEAADIDLARMQPQGDGLLIAVDETNFNQVLQLVAQLENQYQLQVDILDVAKLDQPGQVRVRRLLVTETS